MAPPILHMPCAIFEPQHHTQQVDIDHLPGFSHIELLEDRILQGDSGNEAYHIQFAVLVFNGLVHRLGILFIGNIQFVVKTADAACDLSTITDVANTYPGAVCGKTFRHRFSNARRPTGNEHQLIAERTHVRVSPVFGQSSCG